MKLRGVLTPTVVGVGIGAVVLGGTAAAATTAVMLGEVNKAHDVTTIKNTDGTALKLDSPSGSAPLAVTSSKQVAKLNASLLGGKPSSAFLKKSQRGHVVEIVDSVVDGYGEAHCPAGYHPAGGGGLPTIADTATTVPALVASTYTFNDTTNAPDGWFVAFAGDETYDGTGYVTVSCTDLTDATPATAAAQRLAKQQSRLSNR